MSKAPTKVDTKDFLFKYEKNQVYEALNKFIDFKENDARAKKWNEYEKYICIALLNEIQSCESQGAGCLLLSAQESCMLKLYRKKR